MRTPEQWWIPTDPIAERRLITVLARMAQCVLDHAQELSPVGHVSTGQVAKALDDENLNNNKQGHTACKS